MAKLRTGVGCAEMSHLQSQNIIKGNRVGGIGFWGQGGCERRIEVFGKIHKKIGGGEVGRGGGQVRGRVGGGSGWM